MIGLQVDQGHGSYTSCAQGTPLMILQTGYLRSNVTHILSAHGLLDTLDSYRKTVVDVAKWSEDCNLGGFFAKLETSIITPAGLYTLVYKIIYEFSTIEFEVLAFQNALAAGDFEEMGRAAGQIFSILFEFTVPDS